MIMINIRNVCKINIKVWKFSKCLNISLNVKLKWDKIRECTFLTQNLLTCVQQSQNSIYTEYFYFTHEYYLNLDGKGFWMLNITRVIHIFSLQK